MNAVESMLDIEQLRLSVNEQSVHNAIAQVYQWINVHGIALLKSNQKLPYNFEEAEEIRKFHEKVELKCMNFLAFYAHMNLKTIPEECEPMRQDMDIAIHNFSDRVKARRHVVVLFFTFYRHLDELCNLLRGIKHDDHIHLPDSLADVKDVIDKYHTNTSNCLRRFAHLKDEVNRVQMSLDVVLKLDLDFEMGLVDPIEVKKVLQHIIDLMQQTENMLLSCYESQTLVEMEIKIEAKMMLIEEEISRSSLWLQQIRQIFIDKYQDNAVGKATVENDILQEENRELVKKLELAFEYGRRLKQLYNKLCKQFDRNTDRGDNASSKFEESWKRAEVISREMTERLKIAGNLFHNLDSTLEKVEDLLLVLNRDKITFEKRDSLLQEYQDDVNKIHVEFQNIKKLETVLFNKLRHNLHNNIMSSNEPGFLEIEQTEDMVKMKIFTLLVKIKALDRSLGNEKQPVQQIILTSKDQSIPDIVDYDNTDLADFIKKYIAFMDTSQLNWESKSMPKNLDQTYKAIEAHKKLADQSHSYWKNIQNAVSEYLDRSPKNKGDKEINDLLTTAENRKRKWDKKWNDHLKHKLNPRLQFLLKLQKLNNDIEEDLSVLEDMTTKPNHSLSLVKELNEELEGMAAQRKDNIFDELRKEAHQFTKPNFNNLISSTEEKLDSCNNRLCQFLELLRLIQQIHEFLPHLNRFKNDWPNRVEMCRNSAVKLAELLELTEQIVAQIDEFDIQRLRELATAVHGSSKKVQWLIDELRVDFSIPEQNKIHPVYETQYQSGNFDDMDGRKEPRNRKLLLVNAESNNPTKLDFAFDSLHGINSDQYDILWYKDNEPIRPDRDPRFVIQCLPQSGQLKMEIDQCQESDAGKYWCEVRNPSLGVRKSSPVLLSVFSVKQGNIEPQFGDKTYAAIGNQLSLKLKLDGFKYSPESDLYFNKSLVNVNHTNCSWTRISSNEVLEFYNRSISLNDQGIYDFQVSGNIVAQTHLEVGEKPVADHHELSETCQIGQFIKIEIPLRNFKDINPKNIVWKKDGYSLKPDTLDYTTYVSSSGELVLEIQCFTMLHAGKYTCQISNDFGSETIKLSLKIKENIVPKNVIPIQSSVHENVTANTGDSIILDFAFSPGLNANVLWTKDNQPINVKRDSRIQIWNENDSNSVLKIFNATISDGGFYKASIQETGQNKITKVDIRPSSFAPIVQDFPKSVRVKQNGSVNIVCVVSSMPIAQSADWTVKPADGGLFRNLMNDNRFTIINKPFNNSSDRMQRIELFFENASLSDSGEYCLRVENPVGWTSVTIPVTVSSVGNAQNKKSLPQFSQPLEIEKSAQTNDGVSLMCKVVGNPTPVVKWSKNNKDLYESNRIRIVKTGECHKLHIANLQPSDTGAYQASASNGLGLEVSTCHLKVADSLDFVDHKMSLEESSLPSAAIRDREPDMNINTSRRTQMIFSNVVVRSPPQFVTTFTDRVVREGDDVLLKCCLIGYPEPMVWWSYNTHFINNPRFELSRELDEYLLLVRNIQKGDSGRYSITAENSSGLATCSALIIVESNRFKNNLVDRSKYPTNSRTITKDSNILKPRAYDESRIIQASPREYIDRSNASTPRYFPNDLSEAEYASVPDVSTTTTKTIKTYHYSGPSGVELPGIGFIPKIVTTQNTTSSSSSSSTKSKIGVAKFVPGDRPVPDSGTVPKYHVNEDPSRFSVVESSECDFPL